MTMFFFTADTQRSRAFYERVLGLDFSSFGPHWHQAQAGGATFALHGREGGDVRPEDTGTLFMGFNVDDVREVVRRCRELGAEVVKDVYDEAFGKVALVKDPEGRTLRFVQH
jgi:predicted enzyme related to lactoylglutathione lyase